MTEQLQAMSKTAELNVSQLKLDYMLPSFPLPNAPSWSQINPIASAALDRFMASEGPAMMLLQSPSYLDVRSFLANRIELTTTDQVVVYLPSPWDTKTHITLLTTKPHDRYLRQAFSGLNKLSKEKREQGLKDIGNYSGFSDNQELLDYLPKLSDYLWHNESFVGQLSEQIHTLAQHSNDAIIDIASRSALFGSCDYNRQTQQLQLRGGALQIQGTQVFAIQLESLLSHPELWLELKSVIQSKKITWESAQRTSHCPIPDLPALACSSKIVIYADAELIHGLREMDPQAAAIFSDICELKSQLKRNPEATKAYLSQLNYLMEKQGLASLNEDAAKFAIERATRLAEHRDYMSLYFNSLIRTFRLFQQSYQSNYSLNELYVCQNILLSQISAARDYSTQGFVEKFVHLQVNDKCVAQINGLSVLEHEGVGLSFGEPMRITASVHNGDGEVIDIERKAELGGNIHAKSMMIIQNFINQLLASDHQLPFSASIVFEQSYSDIDGDSASLAGLLVLFSALSRLPIHQSLAVTGAIDQSGSVLAIGGINEKIEGFYDVCQKLGPHAKQGVVIPASNVQQLCLRPDIIKAIQNGQFHIYPVSFLSEAVALFFDKPLSNPEQDDTVLTHIIKRIEQLTSDDKEGDFGLLNRIKGLFSQKTN